MTNVILPVNYSELHQLAIRFHESNFIKNVHQRLYFKDIKGNEWSMQKPQYIEMIDYINNYLY